MMKCFLLESRPCKAYLCDLENIQLMFVAWLHCFANTVTGTYAGKYMKNTRADQTRKYYVCDEHAQKTNLCAHAHIMAT